MPTSEITADAAGTWTLGDLTVRRMRLGSMRLTASADTDRALAVLHRAVELGVDHVDTAAFYRSPGGILDGEPGPVRHATELIREALAPYDGLVVTTKVGPGISEDGEFYQASTADQLRRQVEENLRRLGRDHLDEAQAIAPVVCVQNGYALDQQDDTELLKACGERGIAFVPFFAIAGTRREDGAGDDHAPALTQVARAHGVTEQQVRLAWTLHQGPHVLAIPGTGDPRHVDDNVAAGALRLTDEELALLG